jgi:hypothetical protein
VTDATRPSAGIGTTVPTTAQCAELGVRTVASGDLITVTGKITTVVGSVQGGRE